MCSPLVEIKLIKLNFYFDSLATPYLAYSSRFLLLHILLVYLLLICIVWYDIMFNISYIYARLQLLISKHSEHAQNFNILAWSRRTTLCGPDQPLTIICRRLLPLVGPFPLPSPIGPPINPPPSPIGRGRSGCALCGLCGHIYLFIISINCLWPRVIEFHMLGWGGGGRGDTNNSLTHPLKG